MQQFSFFNIKFADLIADECASSVDTTIVNNSVWFTTTDEETPKEEVSGKKESKEKLRKIKK